MPSDKYDPNVMMYGFRLSQFLASGAPKSVKES